MLEDGESGYERTPDGKLLWKTGDGVTHWNDLPYPSILVDRIYRYRGSVATVEDLPADAAEGDVYNITSTGANYAWTGTQWDNLGVVQEIDPAPVKGSGNPVASGGVYAALEDMQTDIAAAGAPDDVTIIKDESGKLVAQDIAIGGDPTDLASARGYIVDELLPWYPGYFDTPLADFDAATILGRYHVAVHKETTLNAPPILLFTTGTTSNDGMLMVEAMSSATGISSVVRYRQTFMVFGAASKIWVRHQGTSGEWQAWREIIADTNIGDGIRVTGGILSVPEYEGATATEPGNCRACESRCFCGKRLCVPWRRDMAGEYQCQGRRSHHRQGWERCDFRYSRPGLSTMIPLFWINTASWRQRVFRSMAGLFLSYRQQISG